MYVNQPNDPPDPSLGVVKAIRVSDVSLEKMLANIGPEGLTSMLDGMARRLRDQAIVLQREIWELHSSRLELVQSHARLVSQYYGLVAYLRGLDPERYACDPEGGASGTLESY